MGELEKRIVENKNKIISLLNENIDLEYQLQFEGAKEVVEEERTVGRGKTKKTYNLKVVKWDMPFSDDDSDEVISIERSTIVEVDGEKTFGWEPLEYYKPITETK